MSASKDLATRDSHLFSKSLSTTLETHTNAIFVGICVTMHPLRRGNKHFVVVETSRKYQIDATAAARYLPHGSDVTIDKTGDADASSWARSDRHRRRLRRCFGFGSRWYLPGRTCSRRFQSISFPPPRSSQYRRMVSPGTSPCGASPLLPPVFQRH